VRGERDEIPGNNLQRRASASPVQLSDHDPIKSLTSGKNPSEVQNYHSVAS